jgi:hypothetical protein
MDKLAGLFSNIELSIRHLLSGVAVYAIYLLGLCDPGPHIEWIGEQPVLAAFVAGAVGFTVYSLYRIIFWVVGDGAAWLLRISAPSTERGTSKLYHSAYASFLLWRRKAGFNEALNGYLHYRWAVVHFTYIVTFTLWFALANREPHSLIEQWQCYAVAASAVLLVVAVWQSSFLFRVERELYLRMRNSEVQQGAQADGPVSGGPAA